MSALTEAVQAHDAAQERERAAQDALRAAQAHTLTIRQQVASGSGENVLPADIAEADAAVEHARLRLQGATVGLHELGVAVQNARADELCNSIVSTLPELGNDLASALEALSGPLAEVVRAAKAYDVFASESAERVETVARPMLAQAPVAAPPKRPGGTIESPFAGATAPEPVAEAPRPAIAARVRFGGPAPVVDRIPLAPIRGASQLASVLVPVLRSLGAPDYVVNAFKELGAAAPSIPTS